MNNRIIVVLLLLFCAPLNLLAQKTDWGNWWMYFGNKRLNNKWNWHHEVQYRNFNFLGNTDQLLLRTGIGYNLSENNNNLLIGYGFIYSEPYITGTDIKTHFNEHRIFQQFTTRQHFGRFFLQHRYRFEQRIFTNSFKLRLRYFLGANIALNHKEMIDKTVYLSLYNEIFINTQQNFFDRNRAYAGLGFMFSKHLRTELSVMNQSTITISRNLLQVAAYVSF